MGQIREKVGDIGMAQKVFNLPESTSRTQTYNITVPGLKEIENISVNTGTVSIEKVEGEEVTIRLASGSYSRRVKTGGSAADSKWVTNQPSASYNSGGYSGTLTKYTYSGSYTPKDSKEATATREISGLDRWSGNDPGDTYSYSSGGYSGTLYTYKAEGSGKMSTLPDGTQLEGRIIYYKGTVTKPASDTRVYRYEGTVTKPDTRTYQNYYRYNVTVNYIDNSPPTVSGQDANLGDKNTGFTVSYSVNDTDLTDTLTVKEKINGVTIRTLNNAPKNQEFTIAITEEMLYSYDLYTTNTIEIEVSDGQGHAVYRRYTFKRTNTAPKISGQDANLGEKTEGVDITFSATDQENDAMSAKVYLNDKLVKTYEVIEPNQEYTYTLPKLDFVQLNNTDVHKIRVEVQDHNNATALRNYTFTRSLTRVLYAFEKETDIMATQILISPTWGIAEGAEPKVLVCNNLFDEIPTWEDATEQVLLERHFNFTNTAKTGATWGIGVQIIINKGTATELSYLAGFGGAYK